MPVICLQLQKHLFPFFSSFFHCYLSEVESLLSEGLGSGYAARRKGFSMVSSVLSADVHTQKENGEKNVVSQDRLLKYPGKINTEA